MKTNIQLQRFERVIIVGMILPKEELPKNQVLDELEDLVVSARGIVFDKILQVRETPDPAYLIGKGKAAELAEMIKRHHIHCVIFDDDLSPTQHRNLEKILDAKVIDRTGLILDVFARRAKTKEGILNVELAQYSYLLSHLTGKGKELSQQWGGIGTRGPGERALEYDRRRIRTKIQHIKKELNKVRRERSIQRAKRQKEGIALIALIGYTNVGKSSLLNVLVKSRKEILTPLSFTNGDHKGPAHADDRLFATLDTMTRRIYLPSGFPALVTDTVGFIRKLPTHLVASFRATLEEIEEADALIHVVDPTVHWQEERLHEKTVADILKDLHLDQQPLIKVFSKSDLVNASKREELRADSTPGIWVSSATHEGILPLLKTIEDSLVGSWPKASIHLKAKDGHLISQFYQIGRVLDFQGDGRGGYRILIQAPREQIAKLQGLARAAYKNS